MKLKNNTSGLKLNQKSKEKINRSAKKKISRRTQPLLDRVEGTLLEKPFILIVCEGENTEPSYFRQFRLSSATIKPIGLGFNTITLVKRAIELSKDKFYDQIWCVFDADPKPDNTQQAKNFNAAIKLAEECNFGVAYSNQAFEYWLILHFIAHQGGSMHRNDYNKKLNQVLKPFNLTYDGKGTKIITEEIFEVLDGVDEIIKKNRKNLAIERAEKIYNELDHMNPAKEESSTTVFKLVEELLKYR